MPFALLLLSCFLSSCAPKGNQQNTIYQATSQTQNSSYYSPADGKKGAALKTAMCQIISSHTTLSYSDLWDCYKTTDVTEDGNIWDMYSNITKYKPGGPAQGRSYSGEGDSYNREHSLPQSWFNEQSPMKTDLYHVVPTDGYVNNRRGNLDLGEVGNVDFKSYNGFSKLGTPTSALRENGCTNGKVFEPNDIYKGDFARIYFYMVTCYEKRISSWQGTRMLNGTAYPGFSKWAKEMLLEWAENDQVSKKETNRQEAVFKLQKNRNPFVDFPGLEQYIWGTWQDSTFSVSNYRNPYGNTRKNPESQKAKGKERNVSQTSNTKSHKGEYVLLKEAPKKWEGTYLIAWRGEDGKVRILDGSLTLLDKSNNAISVNASDCSIASNATTDAAAFQISATSKPNWYSIKSASGFYIGKSIKKNGLEQSKTFSEDFGHQLSIKDGEAILKSVCGYTLRFNDVPSTGNRFRYYNDSQEAILLFKQ